MKIISGGKIILRKEDKMENFKTRKLDASDYHVAHPKMKALDKVLTNYVLLKDNCSCTEKDYEVFKIDILNSLFHPPQEVRK